MKRVLLFVKRAFVTGLVTTMLSSLIGCGDTGDSWPTAGLGTHLPTPESGQVDISIDYETSFMADIEKVTLDDYKAYVELCKERGYVIDVEENNSNYSAYNEEGYKLTLSFRESAKTIAISLDEPLVKGEITWPTIGLATLLPTPDSTKGTKLVDSSSQFTAYIGEVSYEEYRSYVNQCIELGFDIDYSDGEDYYSASNANGDKIHIMYVGFNTMSIALYASDKEEVTETENESVETTESEGLDIDETISESLESTDTETTVDEPTTEDTTELVDGMRPEFKEAMDSYETMMNEYCDFMEKYIASPSDLTLIADYAKYWETYTEAMEKLSAIEDGEMNDAENKYYIEVTGRVSERLAKVAM